VQNTKRGERLTVRPARPYPGGHLQAEGTYTEKRPAEARGGQHRTGVRHRRSGIAGGRRPGGEQGRAVQPAAVCGFAFDPHVGENSVVIEKQFGRLRVVCVRMNPDLAMGDELLKKTGAGNLFMVFGEPDVTCRSRRNGQVIVEVAAASTSSTDQRRDPFERAGRHRLLFIDTDYNGESFFVRHAYFLGAQEPYEKLKRALRAEIDEAEWAKLLRFAQRAVRVSPKGKIAVERSSTTMATKYSRWYDAPSERRA